MNLPPQELSQKNVKHREDEVHHKEPVQFLAYKTLPTLKTQMLHKCNNVDVNTFQNQKTSIAAVSQVLIICVLLRGDDYCIQQLSAGSQIQVRCF